MKKNALKALSFGSLRAKLLSTVAMLLVASTLLVTSSYAWFVMSTAPEVTGIDTQVGANGALEIALLNQESWDNLSKLDMGDIDESATGALSTVAANLTWGNLVDLANPSYGLSKITLMPARLAIQENGNDADGSKAYAVQDYLLKTPSYGEDGRVEKLLTTAKANTYEDGSFKGAGHGVRAVGTISNMNVYQLGMNSARAQLSNYMAAARNEASKALQDNGSKLANIVVQYVLKDKTSGYTVDDINAVKSMTEGLQRALTQIENALRQAYAGYAATVSANLGEAAYQEALTYIAGSANTLANIKDRYLDASAVILGGTNNEKKNLGEYVDKLLEMQATVNTAIAECNNALASSPTGGYAWSVISGIISPLLNTDKLTMKHKTEGYQDINTVKENVKKEGGGVDIAKAANYLPIEVGAPTGSGIISDVADFADDYSAKVNIDVSEILESSGEQTMDAQMITRTTQSPVYLRVCLNCMATAELPGATGGATITDFYGYAIDLAFRTNAAKANKTTSGLVLQTEPKNRVYDGGENTALQGGGSYMTFSAIGTLSATKMVKLMDGIRVVFLDKNTNVLALAKLDTTLSQNMYEAGENNTYSLKPTAWTDYEPQNSDIIDAEEYGRLQNNSGVTFAVDVDGHNTVTAKLYLYTFTMPNSKVKEDQKTGAIAIGAQKKDATITQLTPNEAKAVTALVYLDGSVVTNATVAADAAQSMKGTLNLQFSSDVELMPAQNTALQKGKTEQP